MPNEPLPRLSEDRGTAIRLLLETDVNLDGPNPADIKRLIETVVRTIHEQLKDFVPQTKLTVLDPEQ